MLATYELISHSPTYTKTVTIQNISKLIDFNEREAQRFSFPYFMIEYISKNCNINLSQNLMKCCKYLRLLQIRIGFSHFNVLGLSLHKKRRGCKNLNIELRFRIFENMPLCVAVIEDVKKFVIEFKKIKVWQHLSLKFIQNYQNEYERLLKLLDLSNLRELACNGNQSFIPNEIIENIMQPSLEKVYFDVTVQQSYFKLLCFVFETLQNVSDLDITSITVMNPPLRSTMINSLLTIKRKTKFKNCKLGCIDLSDIDVNEIFAFCDTFMEVEGILTLTFFTLRINPDFIIEFRNAKKVREENGIQSCGIVCLFLDQDPDYDFDAHRIII